VSSFTVIRLDTTAPDVVWGPTDGAVLGEEFTIEYVIDADGEIVSAELELVDSRTLAMSVEPTLLRVQLPDDAPEGLATISALARDDVGNEAVRFIQVPISGEVYVPPFVPGAVGGIPSEEPKRWHTAARTRSRYRVVIHGGATTVSFMRATARYTIHRSTLRSSRSRLLTASRGRVRGHVTSTMSSARLHAEWEIRRRPEGPDAEEELILLGLL
jgi:hypothetical protein